MLNRRQYAERDVALIIRDLVETLQHLHSRNIVHLDLKVTISSERREENSISTMPFFSPSIFISTIDTSHCERNCSASPTPVI